MSPVSKNTRQKNLVTLAALVAVIVLLFFVTIVKISLTL